jgi:hypothetical protein
MILDREEQPRYLFNIAQDPYEMYNLLNTGIDKQESLYRQFLAYKDSIDQDKINNVRLSKPQVSN